MKNFTEADIRDLVVYLNSHYGSDDWCMNSIIEAIDNYAYEHDFINDIKVEGVLCQNEEIEHGYWAYCGIDAILETDYDKSYYIVDFSYEDGAICVYVTPVSKSDYDAYWDKYAWEENHYDKYEDN